MSEKWRRVWALEVGVPNGAATRFEGMRMAFKATQSSESANTCDVSIWMPSKELMGSLYETDTVVRVLAGYIETGPVEVAQGTVVKDSVRDKRAAAEPLVSWQVSPSKAAVARAAVSKTWSRVRASEVIEYLRQQMGIPADVIDLPTDVLYARGHSVEKSPSTALTEVVADCGAQWTIQDGRLRIWAIGGVARDTATLWAPSSGLLETASPAGDNRVGARALLEPGLRPGDTVRVQSELWSGDICTHECVHEGDSFGEAWFTSVTGTANNA